MHMTRQFLSRKAILFFGLGVLAQAQIANAQIDITWNGSGDGTTFSDDVNWTPSAGVGGPEFQFMNDSLKFNTAGTTITNDLDPATNVTVGSEGDPVLLNHGTGTSANSGSFHFQASAGNFTFDGFPVEVGLGNTATSTIVRADAGAGLTQTFDMPIQFSGSGNRSRSVVLNNTVVDPETNLPTTYGEVVFNGVISYANDRILIDQSPGRVVINNNNTGSGVPSLTPANSTNLARSTIRNNGSAFASEIVLGNDGALIAGSTTGTWANGDLLLIGGIQSVAAAYVTTTAPLDLSDNYFHLAGGVGAVGGSVNYRSDFDSSIGYVFGTSGNRRLKVGGAGALTIENGVFAGGSETGRVILLLADGTSGPVPGANGEIIINGPLHNTFIDPLSWAANGTNAGGGIATPRNDISSATTGMDTYAAVRALYGTFRLNADSSSTWISSIYRGMTGSTTFVGHDNAFGDSNSLVSVEDTSIIDIGSHTIEQKFIINDGTIRGTGTLTNAEDWSITGTVQPGSDSPAASDSLTFDFSTAAVGNTLQFESSSTVDFVLDAGLTSSTIDVLGPSLGGTTSVVLNDNTFSFTDLTAGSLAVGSYTLFDGDANTSYTLGAGVALVGLDGYSGTLSVSGDDVVLDLAVAAGIPGDFNSDGAVDAADYTLFRDNLGVATTLPNDAGLGSPITAAHYTLWTSFYGTTSSSTASAAVPEPGSILLLVAGAVVYGSRRRRM